MQKKVQKLTRENYVVPQGEENVVHYLAERVRFNSETGERLSHPDLVKTGLKMFEMVKRNLELQDYTITILYHPQNKYNNVVVQESPMEEKERELSEASERIAELEKQLAEAKAKAEPKKPSKK